MVAGVRVIRLFFSRRRGRLTEAGGRGVVALEVALHLIRRVAHIDRRRQQLQHQLATVAHALAVGMDHHARLGLARAGGNEHARALELDDADAAGVDRRQRLQIAEGRRVDVDRVTGFEDGASFRNSGRLAVDRQRHRSHGPFLCSGGHERFPFSKSFNLCTPERTAPAAVCPSPQIEASRIT